MKRTIFFLFVLVMASPTMIMAQNQDIDTLFNESSSTLTAVPLIINNPALKTGFGVMEMYFFKINYEY